MKLDTLRRQLRNAKAPKKDLGVERSKAMSAMRACDRCGGPRRIRKREGALYEADCVQCNIVWRGSEHRCQNRNEKGKVCGAPVSKAGAFCYECDEQGGESFVGQEVCNAEAFEFCEYVEGGVPKHLLRCLRCKHTFMVPQEGSLLNRCPGCGSGPVRKP